MKTTIDESMFVNDPRFAGNFSRYGLIALFNFFEECGEEDDVEFDPVGIRCEFSEYLDSDEFTALEWFWMDYNRGEYPDMESISDETPVIYFDKGFIIAAF